MCLLVASLHEIYQIVLFFQTDCNQYAFYCTVEPVLSSHSRETANLAA